MNGSPRRRQGGQIMLLLTLTFVPIVLMIAYLFNTGELLARKQKLQNAADAAALSQANYMARSLNVMAMNNVAISQTLSINVLFESLAPALASMSAQAVPVVAELASEAVAACLGPQALLPSCTYAGTRLGVGATAALYFGTLDGVVVDALAKVGAPGGYVWAYASLNENLANNFAALSQALQSDLATHNGVLGDTRLALLGSTVAAQPENLATELPVIHVDWWNPDPFNADWTEGKNRQQLYNGGLQGTRMDRTQKLQAWNYQFHGYPFDSGPYAVNRDDLYNAYSIVMTALQIFVPEWVSAYTETKDKADHCWQNATTQGLPNPAVLLVLPLGCESTSSTYGIPLFPGVYGFRPQEAPVAWPGIIDLIALTHAKRAGGPVAARYFRSVPGEMFAIARARVYSTTAADLYSSDWRATLTPVFPTPNEQFGHVDPCCGPYYIQEGSDGAVDELVQLLPVLSGSVTWLSKDDWRALLTR